MAVGRGGEPALIRRRGVGAPPPAPQAVQRRAPQASLPAIRTLAQAALFAAEQPLLAAAGRCVRGACRARGPGHVRQSARPSRPGRRAQALSESDVRLGAPSRSHGSGSSSTPRADHLICPSTISSMSHRCRRKSASTPCTSCRTRSQRSKRASWSGQRTV